MGYTSNTPTRYYAHPGREIPDSEDKPDRGLGPGVDIRGDGGYLVAPPSIHPLTGRPYVCADETTPISEVAPALITACTRPPAGPRQSPHLPGRPGQPSLLGTGAGAISSPPALLGALLRRLRDAPEGTWRTTLYGVAHGVARLVQAGALTAPAARDLLLATCRQARWDINFGTHAAITGGFTDEGVHL